MKISIRKHFGYLGISWGKWGGNYDKNLMFWHDFCIGFYLLFFEIGISYKLKDKKFPQNNHRLNKINRKLKTKDNRMINGYDVKIWYLVQFIGFGIYINEKMRIDIFMPFLHVCLYNCIKNGKQINFEFINEWNVAHI